MEPITELGEILVSGRLSCKALRATPHDQQRKEKSIAARAEIGLPFGYKAPSIHCPVCEAVVSQEGDYRGCPHVVFVFLGDLGEFTYVAADHQGALDAIYEDEEIDDVLDEFTRRLDRPSILALTVHSGGMGHGPVWYTDTLVFDFAPRV